MTNPPFSTGALTTLPNTPALDLNPGQGQRSCTYRFALSNGVTGERLGDINPIRGASLSHDTTRTIKRQLHLGVGVVDAATIDPLTARIEPFMILGDGSEWPLGRYLFTDASYQQFTSGDLGNLVLNDEMFLVDQALVAGINGGQQLVSIVIQQALANLPISFTMEASPYKTNQSWSIGTGRGQVLEALSVTGDYFSPWFDNTGRLRFIRSFNPATEVPDLDFDTGYKVFQATILRSSDVLIAPNRFVIVSNSSTDQDQVVVGIADIPPSAPNSFANRGFYITEVQDLQVIDQPQAVAIAQNLAERATVFEKVAMTTAPDPRHDSYNVIKWQDSMWLELSWSLKLVEGGDMTHVLRKGYTQ